MCGMLICAALALGADFGWQPRREGGMEYIIQIEPSTLEMLRGGTDIASDIPPEVPDVRSFRIRVGAERVERVNRAPAADFPPVGPPRSEALPAPPRFGLFQTPVPSEPTRQQPPRPLPQSMSPPIRSEPPVGQLAVYEKTQPDAAPLTQADAAGAGEPAPASRPWFLVVLGLVSSTSGMVYLAWVAWDYRSRYQKLLRQLIDLGQTPVTLAAE